MRYKYKGKRSADFHMLMFFIILLVSGFLIGLVLSGYITLEESDILNSYMSILVKEGNVNNYFVSQFMIGTLSILLVILLGTSLCGVPFISFMIFTKGVQIGFSCALFIITYSFKGILGILIVFIPQIILDVVAFYVVCQYCLHFSMQITTSCLTTTSISLKKKLNKLLNVVLISIVCIFISSYFKATLGIEFIKFFENL